LSISGVTLSASGPIAIGSLATGNGGHDIVAVASAALPELTSVHIHVQGISDLAGNRSPAFSSRFETGSSVDTTPPKLVSRTPQYGETVGIGATVDALFSEPMDPASLTSASFRLTDDRNADVAATIRVSPDGRLASIVPGAPLGVGRSYCYTLDGSV